MQKKRILIIILALIFVILFVYAWLNYEEYINFGGKPFFYDDEEITNFNGLSEIKNLLNLESGEAIIGLGPDESIHSTDFDSIDYYVDKDGTKIINYFNIVDGAKKINVEFNVNSDEMSLYEGKGYVILSNSLEENKYLKVNTTCSDSSEFFDEVFNIKNRNCRIDLTDSTKKGYEEYLLNKKNIGFNESSSNNGDFVSLNKDFFVPYFYSFNNDFDFSKISFFEFLLNKDQIKKKYGENVFLVSFLFSYSPILNEYSKETSQLDKGEYYFWSGEKSIEELNNKCELIVEKLGLSPSEELLLMDKFYSGSIVPKYNTIKEKLLSLYNSSEGKLKFYYCFALIQLDNMTSKNNSDVVEWRKDKFKYDLINLINYSKEKNDDFNLVGPISDISADGLEIDLNEVIEKTGIMLSSENFTVEPNIQDVQLISQSSNYLIINNLRKSSIKVKIELSKTLNGSDYEYSVLIKRG